MLVQILQWGGENSYAQTVLVSGPSTQKGPIVGEAYSLPTGGQLYLCQGSSFVLYGNWTGAMQNRVPQKTKNGSVLGQVIEFVGHEGRFTVFSTTKTIKFYCVTRF